MDLLHETLRLWAMRREFRAVIAELKGYTDRDLGELGLQRGHCACSLGRGRAAHRDPGSYLSQS